MPRATLPLLLFGAAASQRRMVNPCLSPPYSSYKMCDSTAALDDRVEDLVSRLNMSEKIDALDTKELALGSVGLFEYDWWSEASTGVSTDHHGASGWNTTKFAFPITTGMSFNRSLWHSTGRLIGREARSLMNAGCAFSTYWSPVVNLAREPRWGRNIEVPGEDPYLVGEYAKHYVLGFQEAPEAPGSLQASACCKHFVANSMEATTAANGERHDRHEFDAEVPLRDLMDSYLPPFQTCVEEGKVSSLMCSYNSVNGIPSCANGWLLEKVARQEWGFDGYVASDCDAVADVFTTHHFTATPEEAVAAVLKAGTDVDCQSFVGEHAEKALKQGLVTEAEMDKRLRNSFRVRFRLGHFDLSMNSSAPIGALDGLKASEIVCSAESIAASIEGMMQSAALLKNTETLPLKRGMRLAVVGPNAELSRGDASYYGPGNVCGAKFWTLLDALAPGASSVAYAPGLPSASSNDTTGIDAAVWAAAEADAVVLAVGTDLSMAAEGRDADGIAFTSAQAELIARVSAAAKVPVVVVVFTATPLDLTDVLTNPKVGAVLHVGQPSVTILGLGDVLYGDRPPAGRLVQTIYKKAFQDQISIFDFHMRPGPSKFSRPDCLDNNVSACPRGTNPGRTYRFFNGDAVLPFGFGLSYTFFKYNARAATNTISLDALRNTLSKSATTLLSSVDRAVQAVEYAVNVTNTGLVDSDDVVLGFISPPDAGQDGAPLSTLFAFERVHVKAGQTVQVFLYPALAHFTHLDEFGALTALPGKYAVRFGVEATLKGGGGFVDAGEITAV